MDYNSHLYQQELHSLYRHIADFTRQNQTCEAEGLLENPHITRLIQAFGVVASNLTIMLEEASTQSMSALFDILYPHYNRHIPSIAMISISLNEKHETCLSIPKGKLVEMEGNIKNNNKYAYKFRVCYDSYISPIKINSASCEPGQGAEESKSFSSLNIQFATLNKTPLSKIGLKKLRLLTKGLSTETYSIYHNVMTNLESIIIRCPKNHNSFVELNNYCIKPVGFGDKENVLPYPCNSFLGYRLITEFFIFPEKFLFFDLILEGIDFSQFGNSIEVCFRLKGKELEGVVSKDNFILNATPIINLCEIESDPVQMESYLFNYPIVMDKKNAENYEIYSIEDVKVGLNNQEVSARKLFDLSYGEKPNNKDFCYSIKNRYSMNSDKPNGLQFISIVDRHGHLLSKNKLPKYFYIRSLCSNGNLPNTAYMTQKGQFKFLEITVPVSKIECITNPTQKYVLGNKINYKLRLTAHLSLNYMNMVNDTNGAELIKQALSIYTENSKFSQLIVDSILDVKVVEDICSVSISRASQFCKGHIIEIYFDQNQLPKGLIYLFFKVLEHFFAIYCSINSFIKLIAKDKEGSLIYVGVPKNGSKCLI
jgi:type VI secretion system protein ImpG